MEDSSDCTPHILKFPIFQGIEKNAEALQFLSNILKYETFQTRDFIINEKQSGQRMFFLIEEQVIINKIDEHGQIIVIGKADASSHPCFGESVLLGKFTRSANVVAHGHCVCLSLDAKDFEAFMQRFPFIVGSIYRTIGGLLFDRLSKANRDMMIQGLMWKNSGS